MPVRTPSRKICLSERFSPDYNLEQCGNVSENIKVVLYFLGHEHPHITVKEDIEKFPRIPVFLVYVEREGSFKVFYAPMKQMCLAPNLELLVDYLKTVIDRLEDHAIPESDSPASLPVEISDEPANLLSRMPDEPTNLPVEISDEPTNLPVEISDESTNLPSRMPDEPTNLPVEISGEPANSVSEISTNSPVEMSDEQEDPVDLSARIFNGPIELEEILAFYRKIFISDLHKAYENCAQRLMKQDDSLSHQILIKMTISHYDTLKKLLS